MLDDANIKYENILAEENVEFVREHKIMSAPTLVTKNGVYSGVGGVSKLIHSLKS